MCVEIHKTMLKVIGNHGCTASLMVIVYMYSVLIVFIVNSTNR